MICTFFGHRDAPSKMEGTIRETIERLISEGVTCFYVGNNGNFDSMVHRQLKAFREEMSWLDPEEVFENAYKIYCITEFYYILTNSYDYTSETVALILNFKGNFLEQIYDEWLSFDISNQDEFEYMIERRII